MPRSATILALLFLMAPARTVAGDVSIDGTMGTEGAPIQLLDEMISSRAKRPVHTFSIVARDSATGEMGVAVQSHWFAVGPSSPGQRQESVQSLRSLSPILTMAG